MEFTVDLAIAYQVVWGLILINVVVAFVTVFRKPRSIASVLAWMVTLVFLPGIGFILYAFCGRGIDGEIVYRFSEDHQNRIAEINDIIEQNNEHFEQTVTTAESKLLKSYFSNMEESPVTRGNQVTFYTDGQKSLPAYLKISARPKTMSMSNTTPSLMIKSAMNCWICWWLKPKKASKFASSLIRGADKPILNFSNL